MAALLTSLVLLILTLWGTLSFLFCSWPATVRYVCIALYLGGSVATLLCVRPWRKTRYTLFGLYGLVLVAWFLMRPSNDREWDTTVARLTYATLEEDAVTFHNIRNFDYSSATHYVPRYYDRTFDLSRLESLDVYLVNWGIEQVSHTMVSFGFGGSDYLCFSFETRKEKGESYSTLKGFFRKYELYCVVADERDVVRLRTHYREGEDVYLYRMIPADRASLHKLFMEYVTMINGLQSHADWYNALTDNCMTSVFKLGRMNAVEGRGKWHWKVILNGYADELAYERGRIDTSVPFPELKALCRVNERARAASGSSNFSQRIREGIPGMGMALKAPQPPR